MGILKTMMAAKAGKSLLGRMSGSSKVSNRGSRRGSTRRGGGGMLGRVVSGVLGGRGRRR